MPLIPLFRVLLGLVSLAVLGAAGYLIWSGWSGEIIVDVDGAPRRVREEWRLRTGMALLAWSVLGRWAVTPLLARPDRDPSRPERSNGALVAGHAGSRLYVERHGPVNGPVIVLTHGWGLDSTIWGYARRDLARFQLLTWDLPGLGRSRLVGELSLETLAENLKAVIGLAGGRPVVLVGHSIGGMIIQTLARDHPEMFAREVAGVVLLNTTWTNPLRTMIFSPLMLALRRPLLEPMMRLARWLQPLAWAGAWQSYLSGSAHIANRFGFGRYVTRSQLEHNTLLATRNPPGVLGRGNLAMFRWDAASALPNLIVPTLVLGGERDIVTRAEASRQIADTAPAGRLQVIDGVNHMGFLERADAYNAAIADFVRGLARRGEPAAVSGFAAGASAE